MSNDAFIKKFGSNRVPEFKIGDRIKIKSKEYADILLKNPAETNSSGMFKIGDTGFVIGMYWTSKGYVYILELDNKFAKGYNVTLGDSTQNSVSSSGWKVKASGIEKLFSTDKNMSDFIKKADTGQIYSVLGVVKVVNPSKYNILDTDILSVVSLSYLHTNVIVNDDRLMSIDNLDILSHSMKYEELSNLLKAEDVFITVNNENIKLTRKQVANILEENKKGVI